jgi:hypothetical protein
VGISARSSTYSRAYIDFKSADDVIDFHQEFDGHTFVNEKGNVESFVLGRFSLGIHNSLYLAGFYRHSI